MNVSEDEEKNVSWFWNENETSPCISLTVLPVDLGYVNKMASVYAMLNDVLLMFVVEGHPKLVHRLYPFDLPPLRRDLDHGHDRNYDCNRGHVRGHGHGLDSRRDFCYETETETVFFFCLVRLCL